MDVAGLEYWALPDGQPLRLSRTVHNRKWYHRVRNARMGGWSCCWFHRRA